VGKFILFIVNDVRTSLLQISHWKCIRVLRKWR